MSPRSSSSLLTPGFALVRAAAFGGLLLAVPGFDAAAAESAVRVDRWSPHDFVFTSQAKPENPFAVRFSAKVTGPDGRTFTQPGFFDGGNTWKVRVSANQPGAWSIVTQSDLADLDGRNARFACTGNTPRIRTTSSMKTARDSICSPTSATGSGRSTPATPPSPRSSGSSIASRPTASITSCSMFLPMTRAGGRRRPSPPTTARRPSPPGPARSPCSTCGVEAAACSSSGCYSTRSLGSSAKSSSPGTPNGAALIEPSASFPPRIARRGTAPPGFSAEAAGIGT
ncbi:MAG: DUF5060 domain-containing protein [Verrucomicrobia bacterium]|nr:DUF5060 domain-containing protein [Verrucomicrobiota bacterium]